MSHVECCRINSIPPKSLLSQVDFFYIKTINSKNSKRKIIITKAGKTKMILEDTEGNKTIYDIDIKRNSFD